jgi:hypothetical protein
MTFVIVPVTVIRILANKDEFVNRLLTTEQ